MARACCPTFREDLAMETESVTFEKRTITVQAVWEDEPGCTFDYDREAQVGIRTGLAYFPVITDEYQITHLVSGKSIGTVETEQQAQRAIETLSELFIGKMAQLSNQARKSR
jgi:hypothetical protein